MAISGEINLFGFRNSMKLWILNIGIVAVGGQQCLYDYISQFQSVSRLPKEDSSAPAGQTSQQDFKRNGLSGEDLWQVEHRWPRSWKLHIWIGHEPGAKFFVTTCFWPPSHALDNILLNYKLALEKRLLTSQTSSWRHNLVAHNDLHHLHWVAELRWLLCRQSFLRYCKSHRSAQDPSGHYKHWAFFFKCHPGCWEGWDLPWGWLVWKGRQCQQRSNQRWSCLCFTAIDILFSILATAVVNILSFHLDVHTQAISSALPLRWVSWWLPTWTQLELSLPISSLQGNACWWLLCYQLCTSRCICRCIHTLIQWELSSTVVGY